MQIYTTYKVKIKCYNHIFKDTVKVYRNAVDYLIDVCNANWDSLLRTGSSLQRQRYIETLIHTTKDNPNPKYDFDSKFYNEYSCAMKSHFRKSGNQMSGKWKSSFTSLLA